MMQHKMGRDLRNMAMALDNNKMECNPTLYTAMDNLISRMHRVADLMAPPEQFARPLVLQGVDGCAEEPA